MWSTISLKLRIPAKTYPYFGIYDDDYIVLFIKPSVGIVVWKSNTSLTPHELGKYHESWVENQFTYFTGQLTIGN